MPGSVEGSEMDDWEAGFDMRGVLIEVAIVVMGLWQNSSAEKVCSSS